MILINALRADRLGVYGHTRKLPPAMDAIAADPLEQNDLAAASPDEVKPLGYVE